MLSAREVGARLARDPAAIAGGAVLAVLVATAAAAPFLAPDAPFAALAPEPPGALATEDVAEGALPPFWMQGGDARFPLGTDAAGRGVLFAIMQATGITLLIGLGAVAVQAAIGLAIGVVAGYRGGWLDTVLMRAARLQRALSTLLVAILALAAVRLAADGGPAPAEAAAALVLAIGIAGWPRAAMAVRDATGAAAASEHVDAARAFGLPAGRIVRRHLMPAARAPIAAIAAFLLAEALAAEAAVSFLGLGLPASDPSLGTLIRAGFEALPSGAWWVLAFPAAVLVSLLLSLVLIGDALGHALGGALARDPARGA